MAKPLDRAGRYVLQPAGYKAFLPAPLPPHPVIEVDAEMQHLLSDADRALGRLDGSIQTLPNPDLFVFMYVRKEAVLSSQIEGTQASLNDVIKAEAGIHDAGQPGDVLEVINYTTAMNYGLDRLKDLPLSRRLIEEIHARLLHNVRGNKAKPGEVRTTQNWIGAQGSLISEALFVPPPPAVAQQALGDLEKFLHDEGPIPLLIRIGLAHAQFETIHPFLDGNGRVGRLLITFFLCSREILQRPVLYLSLYLRQHRAEYYTRLQAIRDRGEWEEWLKFFLRGVLEVANQAAETAKNIVALREAHRALIADHFGNHAGKGMRLLERLYERPTVTVKDVAKLLDISFPNANTLVGKFLRHDVLTEITGQSRNRVFSYQPYLNLFASL